MKNSLYFYSILFWCACLCAEIRWTPPVLPPEKLLQNIDFAIENSKRTIKIIEDNLANDILITRWKRMLRTLQEGFQSDQAKQSNQSAIRELENKIGEKIASYVDSIQYAAQNIEKLEQEKAALLNKQSNTGAASTSQ